VLLVDLVSRFSLSGDLSLSIVALSRSIFLCPSVSLYFAHITRHRSVAPLPISRPQRFNVSIAFSVGSGGEHARLIPTEVNLYLYETVVLSTL